LIDWESDSSHVLLNPRMPAAEREQLARAVPKWLRTIFVATSGTTGSLKLVALTKEAILASAAAVNERLGAVRDDIWVRVLPPFHVGGLGVHARAFLTGSKVIEMDWDVDAFVRSGATLTSLVPAQVHDLVRMRVEAPAGLRHVLVGGGAFDPTLQARARSLGWPVLASYGMSECASTVSVEEELLSHLSARQDPHGRIALAGPSLFKAYVLADGSIVDPKIGGWFVSEDLGEVDGRRLRIRGRSSDFIKVGGESVDLNRLDAILNSVIPRGADAAILAVTDERLGHVIELAATGEASSIVEAFNAQVAPFERIRAVRQVSRIPRSSLGKLLRGELAKIVE
jgi:O-succinylbenzoic acid--CoA ligase